MAKMVPLPANSIERTSDAPIAAAIFSRLVAGVWAAAAHGKSGATSTSAMTRAASVLGMMVLLDLRVEADATAEGSRPSSDLVQGWLAASDATDVFGDHLRACRQHPLGPA